MQRVAIVSPLRTPVGTFWGALRDVPVRLRMVTTLRHELRRRGGGQGLVTMCVGGGQGLAATVEAA